MPDTVQFKNGNQIVNVYDASGKKLRSKSYTVLIPEYIPLINTLAPGKIVSLERYDTDIVYFTGTDYFDNIEYGIGSCDPEPYQQYRIYNGEGYCVSGEDTPTSYYYYRRDHLGNNREVWQAPYTLGNTTYPATTIQRTQYYPSGLPWQEGEGTNVQNKKYNGKEWIEAHGYDMYDYHARGYYPAIMRFTTIDPLAEKYYSISPYAYCANNPVMYIDPDGKARIKVSANFSMNTGFIGVTAKLLGIGINATVAPLGGYKQEISVYLLYDTDSKKIGMGVSHTQTEYQYSYDGTAGIISGGTSKEKSTIMDANTIDKGKGTIQKDTSFEKKESAGIVINKVSGTTGSDKKELNSSVAANVGMVGAEVKGSISIEPSPGRKTSSDNASKTNIQQHSKEKTNTTISPIKPKDPWYFQ